MPATRKRTPRPLVADHPNAHLFALYARVSSDEQAEAETIKVQLDYLNRYCDLNQHPIAGVYKDEAVSGTIPLAERKNGARLLHDASNGAFGTVLFMRVNRFARRLSVAIDGYEELADAGVAIKSATEPIDTNDPIGRFVFQMLGAFAELDRETIIDNTSRGRVRGARDNRWYGVVPLGYVVKDRRLSPNTGEIAPGIGEAALVVNIFERVAAGSSGVREVARLAGLGLQPFVRYMKHDGQELIKPAGDEWTLTRITRMIRNPLYQGTRTFRGRHGEIEQEVPALVSPDVWERANQQLTDNRKLSKRNATHSYLMRGLIRCGRCGSAYRGGFVTTNERRYYRCGRVSINRGADAANGPARRACGGKVIDAAWLEEQIWSACESFLRDPGPVLDEARSQYVARLRIVANVDERRRELSEKLAAHDNERAEIFRLARQGLLRDDELRVQLGEIEAGRTATAKQLEAVLDLQQQAELQRRQEHSIDRLLARIRALLSRGVDDQTKVDVVRLLVDHIAVETSGTGAAKSARLHVLYRFPGLGDPEAGHGTADESSTDLRIA